MLVHRRVFDRQDALAFAGREGAAHRQVGHGHRVRGPGAWRRAGSGGGQGGDVVDPAHAAVGRQAAQLADQVLAVERLGQVTAGAEPLGLVDKIEVFFGRQHEHLGAIEKASRAELAEKFQAAAVRHMQVK